MLDWLNFLFTDPAYSRIALLIVGLLVINALAWLAQRWVGQAVQNADARYQMRKLFTYLSYLIMALFVVSLFSDSLSQLAVIFGVAGAGVAFALQEVIVSVAGWAAIAFGGFYRVGDRVQLGGITGDVIDIAILRTTLMETGQWVKAEQYNGRIVRVANSFVFKEPVFNYSADFPFLWDEINVPIKYGGDRQLARDILYRVAQEVVADYAASARQAWTAMVRRYRIEEARLEPMVTLVANDNWLEFSLRYVVDYKLRRVTKDRLFTRLLEEFDQTDGKVAIASMTVHLVETPTFDVRLQHTSLGATRQ